MSPLAKVLVALVAVASVAEVAAGKNYTIQWAVNGNYGDWSAGNPLRVGDTVVFTYEQSHTVDELSQPDYEACNFAARISTDGSGRTEFTFDKAGTRYFACAAGAGSHCSQGQKVAITVADGTVGAQSPSPPAPKGNSAAPVAGAAALAVKLVMGLGVGGAVLGAF